MAFDYKKEYKEFYMPPAKPSVIDIPEMNFIAVHGEGDPNREDGEYSKALNLLYGAAYTLKMSYKGDYRIEGFFEYVVPPLEGFWSQAAGDDYSKKDEFLWTSVIRLPDFVTEKDLEWAKAEAAQKKKTDFSPVQFLSYHEGLCVQCMHIGSYDNEAQTISAMNSFAKENGYETDISDIRRHHEIYLSDPRKTEISKLKTVIRHPVRKAEN